MASLRKSLLQKSQKRLPFCGVNDWTPIKWNRYFTEEKSINVGESTFHVYSIGNSKPTLVLLHGGGYSALTWGLLAVEITNKIECQILAIDLRGHGNTKTDDEDDLSLQTLAVDVAQVLNGFFSGDIPPVILIGHSLGGAIAVEASGLGLPVEGLCIIDIVEGTALESLGAMQSILRGRPSSFRSIEHAIQWSFRSGQTHNLEAARLSMPGQIKNAKTGKLASCECDARGSSDSSKHRSETTMLKFLHQRSADAIEELDEEAGDELVVNRGSHRVPLIHHLFTLPTSGSRTENVYKWRIDLSKTEPYWNGWFKGLSQKFLDISYPKVLLLANIHGLDTSLTVGQMQGKFQLQVLPRSGHAIHEDQPTHVADIIAGFLVKQKLATSKNGFVPIFPAC